jgi:hypothetical protein
VAMSEAVKEVKFIYFVRENLDDGIIKIEFIKSVEIQSDIFTKNVTQEIYERHIKKVFGGVYQRGV